MSGPFKPQKDPTKKNVLQQQKILPIFCEFLLGISVSVGRWKKLIYCSGVTVSTIKKRHRIDLNTNAKNTKKKNLSLIYT